MTDFYPPVEQIVEQCGKFRLLDRLLAQLFTRKHKVHLQMSHVDFICFLELSYHLQLIFFQVLIFSQWTKILDIMDYYFSEKGFEVCRIDGMVKLDERKRQVSLDPFSLKKI